MNTFQPSPTGTLPVADDDIRWYRYRDCIIQDVICRITVLIERPIPTAVVRSNDDMLRKAPTSAMLIKKASRFALQRRVCGNAYHEVVVITEVS